MLLPFSNVLGFTFYNDTGVGRATTHKLYSSDQVVCCCPMAPLRPKYMPQLSGPPLGPGDNWAAVSPLPLPTPKYDNVIKCRAKCGAAQGAESTRCRGSYLNISEISPGFGPTTWSWEGMDSNLLSLKSICITRQSIALYRYIGVVRYNRKNVKIWSLLLNSFNTGRFRSCAWLLVLLALPYTTLQQWVHYSTV